MKKIYFLLIALCFFTMAKAQIVNIPDANFKAKLLAANPSNTIAEGVAYGVFITIDTNNNGEIEESEAKAVRKLRIANSGITDLTGIKKFTNLGRLFCGNNLLTSIDISQMSSLSILVCNNNNLQNVDLSKTNLQNINFDNNPELVSLNVKNKYDTTPKAPTPPGLSDPDMEGFGISFSGTPNLYSICADEYEVEKYENLVTSYGYNCIVSSYCTMVPGSTYYTVQGLQQYDGNNDGCDITDGAVMQLKYKLKNASYSDLNIFSNSVTGNYSLLLAGGITNITPILENPTYFTVSPTTTMVSFPTQTSPFVQDFCITPNGVHPDLEIILIPLGVARPGFDAKYKIVYKNKGTQTDSGTVNLNFDNSVFHFLTATPVVSSQVSNNLLWEYSDLKPFESRHIFLTLKLNAPTDTPSVKGGEVLYHTATITSPESDETQNDNVSTLYQTVVNSLDPNDKICLEGTTISPDLVGQYVHYMIRFENTGTYPAQNVVVKDIIDLSKFDISTLVPTSASHSYITKISEGNKVEFIFENIMLPFDDENNDGYIAFKIKTLPTLVVGDTFENEANIYFDYNFPVLTNKVTSTFKKTLGTQDFQFATYFTLYPNPAKSVLNINSKETIEVQSISIYNTLGQLVLVVPNAEKVSKIDVSNLTNGNYFIKINSDKGTSNARFIKE